MTTVSETWTDPIANYDLTVGQKVSEAIWDGVMSDILYAARRSEVPLTNKSGGAASAGDVYVVDSANDSAMTTTSLISHIGPVGIARESISNNAVGRFAFIGSVSVKVTGAVARGDFLETSTVAGSAQSVGGTAKTAAAFARAMTASSGGYCTAMLLPSANSGVETVGGDSATLDVVSSVAETTVWTKSIPGGKLGTLNTLWVRLYFSYFNNTGGGQTTTIKFKYGGTTVINQAPSIVNNASRRYGFIDVWFKNAGATNSQKAHFVAHEQTLVASGIAVGTDATSAENSTIDKTASITIQHGLSNASLSFKYEGALAMILPTY